MGLRIKRGQPISREIRRLFDDQLSLAIGCLTEPGGPAARPRIHDARRRVKKARAILRLVREPLGADYRRASRALRRVSLLLGPLTDAQRVIHTLDRVSRLDLSAWPPLLLNRLAALLAARAARVEQRAAFERVRERAVRQLASLQQQAAGWRLPPLTPRMIARGLRRIHAEARAARRWAVRDRTVAAFHDWRRRTKSDWYAFRLIGVCSGHHLADDERRLAVLDGSLGDLHDISVLWDVIASESLVSRAEAAQGLRALRAVRRAHRRQCIVRGRALRERPRDLEARTLALWGSAPAPRALDAPDRRWPRRA